MNSLDVVTFGEAMAMFVAKDVGDLSQVHDFTRRAAGAELNVAIGPPQAVAITPDGKLAIVGAPTRYDYAAKKVIFDTFLQVIDLEATPPKLVDKVELGQHSQGLSKRPFCAVQHLTVPSIPEGVAISPDGKWIAVQSMDGSNLTEDNPWATRPRRACQSCARIRIQSGHRLREGSRRLPATGSPHLLSEVCRHPASSQSR
jgi:hypothetical protein